MEGADQAQPLLSLSPPAPRGLRVPFRAGLGYIKTKARLAELSSSAFPNSSAEFGKHIADEIEPWGKVIRAANVKAG